LEIEDLFSTLQQVGFGRQDVIHLENLSDRQVLRRLPGGFRYLRRNQVADVVLYINTLADLLEEEGQKRANRPRQKYVSQASLALPTG
jgi:hypothetical protein